MTAFCELTVSALMLSSGHETVGVVLYSLEEAGLATIPPTLRLGRVASFTGGALPIAMAIFKLVTL